MMIFIFHSTLYKFCRCNTIFKYPCATNQWTSGGLLWTRQ